MPVQLDEQGSPLSQLLKFFIGSTKFLLISLNALTVKYEEDIIQER